MKNLNEIDHLYGSQGDTSSKRNPKKFFSGSTNSFLIDEKEVKYLDFQMFNSSANFGYKSSSHMEVLRNQIEKLPCLSSEFLSEERVLLSKRICQSIEKSFNQKGKVHFSVGGAQAIDTALMILGAIKGSKRVFAFEGSYHGRTIAATQISASYRYRSNFGGTTDSIFIPFPYCYRCPFQKKYLKCDYYCIQQFERLFSSTSFGLIDSNGKSDVTGFVAEPVLGRGGYIPAPPLYFKKLKAILDRYNVLFIADEVQMGFYRTGKMWAFENYKIDPDLIVFGKAITNGYYPLSGVWARDPILEKENWPSSSAQATFGGSPLGSALANATFELLDDKRRFKQIIKTSARIVNILKKLKAEFKFIGNINSLGLAFSLDIEHLGKPSPILANAIVEYGLNPPKTISHGLIMTQGGLYDNMIMLSPPIFITDKEIILFKELIFKVFYDVYQNFIKSANENIL